MGLTRSLEDAKKAYLQKDIQATIAAHSQNAKGKISLQASDKGKTTLQASDKGKTALQAGKKSKTTLQASEKGKASGKISNDSPAFSSSAGEEHKQGGEYLKSAIYGGLDGIITTFAVVAGVTGAALSPALILILGFANLIADGISMAVGDYLSTKAEREYYNSERKREEWEVKNYPQGEKQEMVELYMQKGISKKGAECMAGVLSKHKQAWVDIMMVEELGMVKEESSPLKNAAVTFASFAIFGFVPLAAYVASLFHPSFAQNSFFMASALTAATLFILGALKTKITSSNWLISGLEMLIVGSLAAGAAYIIGAFLSGLAYPI